MKRSNTVWMYFAAATLFAAVMARTAALADPAVKEIEIKTVKPHAAPEPHSPRAEAQDVIAALQNLVKAYAAGDLDEYQKHLDKECTIFDNKKKQMVEGKDNVIAVLKDDFARHAKGGDEPLIAYTIDQPYVKVTGEMAVVTYHAVQEIGGNKPFKAEAFMTDVFVKDGNEWKKVHERGEWKRMK